MVAESRIGLYDYVHDLLCDEVTKNVYRMSEPQELTKSDTKDGFIVITAGNIVDESEFLNQAYGRVRVFVAAYVPLMSRGRLDKSKYSAMENAINAAINAEINNGTNATYSIQGDSILSMDDFVDTNANNAFSVFVKSFIVNID